jgi:hypothetical protein
MEAGGGMRVPNERHLALDLRIHEIVPDFRLEDVWVLPGIEGTAADFDRAVRMTLGLDPVHSARGAARFLWQARDLLGRWFDLGVVTEPAAGAPQHTLRERLPADLRGTVDGVTYDHLPFVPLYRTETEYAAEVANATVHGVMHLCWVRQGADTYRGQMAVYVKPRGSFGNAYMAFIKPFRYLVVYPAMERNLAREWAGR